MSLKYMDVLSHEYLHMMWNLGLWIFHIRWVLDGKFIYFFICVPWLYLSTDVLFTSMWTVLVMCRSSNHPEMVNIFIVLVVLVSFVKKIRTAKRCDRVWLLGVVWVYWKGAACTFVRLVLQLGSFVLTFRHHLSVPSSGFHFLGSFMFLILIRFQCVND